MSLTETIEKQLNIIFDHLGIKPDTQITQNNDGYEITITGDDLNFLIGYRGESLDALQYMLGHSVYKQTGNWEQIFVDINSYKKAKLEKLDDMLKTFIDRVRFHQKEYRLPPLSAYERKYVHTYIADYLDVKSESKGEGLDRRLFLSPK